MLIDMGSSASGTDLYFGWQQKPGVNFPQSQCFFTNVSGQAKQVCDVSAGFVLDVTDLRTGWQNSETNKWQFGETPSKLPARPGDEWKKGFAVPVALGGGTVAMWMASGATAWDILGYLSPQLAKCPQAGQVPLVDFSGAAEGRYETRTWIFPMLTVRQWINRPESLAERNKIDLGPEPIIASAVAPAPVAAPLAMPPVPPAPPVPQAPPAPPAADAPKTTYF